ncbi:MAG: acyl-CoA carboxylase subunit beta [Candidatus Njordarchaeia archaeon]
MEDKIEKLYDMRKKAMQGGGPEAAERQHKKGKLTARERIELLVDPDSFVEINPFVRHRISWFNMDKKRFYGDGVITGYGSINGRLVYIYAQDFTVIGGSVGEMHANKIAKIYELALKNGAPVIGLIDSGGARIQEGVISLAGYGKIFYNNVLASGVIPQISMILGPCAGGAVYSPALTDFIIVVNDISYMFVTGPEVTKEATGLETSFEELGGAAVHAEKSGVAHFIATNEEEAIQIVKTLLSYLPSNNMEDPPIIETNDDENRMDEDLNTIIPDDPNKPYDMAELILKIVDNGEFLEIQSSFAQNAIVGFARLGGRVIGVVANQPAYIAGVLDIDSSDKISRFIRFCDAFNIPIITFVDTPGFLPGIDQEHGGIIRHGAKILYAYSEATVPKITVIVRKAYGGAYIAMGSSHLGTDYVLAWPSAEIAVMGPKAAARILYRREIAKSRDPEKFLEEVVVEYKKFFANPNVAAEMGYVNDIIEPRETRPRLISALKTLENKRESLPPKKHGLIPL